MDVDGHRQFVTARADFLGVRATDNKWLRADLSWGKIKVGTNPFSVRSNIDDDIASVRLISMTAILGKIGVVLIHEEDGPVCCLFPLTGFPNFLHLHNGPIIVCFC